MQITDTGYLFCVGGKFEYRISVFLIGINDVFDIAGNVFHQILLRIVPFHLLIELLCESVAASPALINDILTVLGDQIFLVVIHKCIVGVGLILRHHCLLHVDGQGMTKASRLAASQYANSLGVGQYVFHELQGGAYTDWEIPCNAIIRCTSAEDIINKAATYKKNGNNIIFYYSSTSGDTTDEKLHSLAEAAHSVGCYTMSWTFNKVDQTRR